MRPMELSLNEAIENARGKAAGIFLPDLARLLCTANEDDWRVVRWIEPPPMDAYLGDLHRLGESLIHGS